jgi:hypothetical protein
MIHTSYSDTGKITPTERKYILSYIMDEAKQQEKKLKEYKEKNKRG